MKNFAPYIIYLESENKYDFISPNKGIDFEDAFSPHNRRIPKRIYNEIDQIKRNKIRRISNPFKNNQQRYS